MTVVEVSSKENFKALLDSAGDKLVVVDFFATWCGPCKMIAPKIVTMAQEYTDVVFLKVDVDDVEDVAQAEEINAMPTFKFFKKTKHIDSIMGANEAKLKEAINKHK